MTINLNEKDTELVKDAVQSYYMISHHALEHYEKKGKQRQGDLHHR